jgi:hypothetical protein
LNPAGSFVKVLRKFKIPSIASKTAALAVGLQQKGYFNDNYSHWSLTIDRHFTRIFIQIDDSKS